MVVGGRELIDTLWNVNNAKASATLNPLPELIDTLWNVNSTMFCPICFDVSSN